MAKARTLVLNTKVEVTGAQKIQGLSQQIKSAFSPKNLAIAGVGAGIAIGSGIIAGLADATKALIDIERLNAQTDAVIRSTGGAANVTRQQIEEAAEAAEAATTIQRESVQEAQNLLLTFTNIRDEAGSGNDIFSQATDSVLDMSVAMGTDARDAALQLGKALNDPIKGMSTLGRAGVQFSEDQKELIESLVETGDLLGAQKVILAELETQFGGSAEAFANTTAGRVQRFQNDVGNMFESIIVGATKVADFLGDDPFEGFAMNFGEQADRIKQISEFTGQTFDDLKAQIETRMDETGESFEDAANGIVRDWNDAAGTLPKTTSEMMGEMYAAAEAGAKDVETIFDDLAKKPAASLEAEYQSIRSAAYQSTVEYAKGLQEGQNLPQVAFDAAMQLVEDEMTRAEEIANLKGKLLTLSHAAGIAAAEGKVASVNAINAAIGVITARLDELNAGAYIYGQNFARQYSAGVINNLGVVADAGRQLASTLRRTVAIESEPSDHSSPLYGHMKWGGNLVRDFAASILGALPTLTAASRTMAGVVGLGTAGAVAVGGGSGGTHITNIYLQWDGEPPKGRSEEEIIANLQRLSPLIGGKLAPGY